MEFFHLAIPTPDNELLVVAVKLDSGVLETKCIIRIDESHSGNYFSLNSRGEAKQLPNCKLSDEEESLVIESLKEFINSGSRR